MDQMFENSEKTPLSELGEFALIDHLTKHFKIGNKSTTIGVGDDAAQLDTDGEQLVISTDLLLENVHFDLMYSPLRHLGYKAAVVNFSDICAMNCVPKQLLVSIGLSSKFTLEAVEELYEGIRLACEKYNVDLIGGDTTSSRQGLVISGTAIGSGRMEKIVRRSGAKKGDLLCVSGDLGAAYFGLQILEREKAVFIENPEMQPDLSGHDYIVGRQLKPEARVDIIKAFDEMGIVPTSMIDVSDGLASEVLHLSKNSNVGFVVHEDKLPIDQTTYNMGVEFKIDATTAVLSGGEDYELLFTLSQDEYDKIKNDSDISVIGYATDLEEGNKLVSKAGQTHDIIAQGWKAF